MIKEGDLMRMQDKDIRRLFQKAEIQVCPEQKRILKMYEYLQNGDRQK